MTEAIARELTRLPVLRYFECRSRGQALRFAFGAFDVAFEDLRVPLGELASFRTDAGRPGAATPFGALPVLDWDGQRVAQVLAIAGYLAARIDPQQGKRSAEQRAFLDMIASAAHLDMQAPYTHLMWLPADCPDAQLEGVAQQLFALLTAKLDQLQVLLAPHTGPFCAGAEPSVADCFVYESLLRASDVFGAQFHDRLDAAPRMRELSRELGARPGVVAERERMPFQVTASPSEPALRERLATLQPR